MVTIDLTNESDSEASASAADEQADTNQIYFFVVHGNPTPMPRSRFFKKGLFHKRRTEMSFFKEMVRANMQNSSSLLFEKGVPLKMVVRFYMKRPLSDFKNQTREDGGLRSTALSRMWTPITPDIDNLAKFVLDALNGVVYEDDKQVVILTLLKIRDCTGECSGRTEVHVSKATQDDLSLAASRMS